MQFSLITPKQLYDIENSNLYKKNHHVFNEKFLQTYRRHSLLNENVKKLSNTIHKPHKNYNTPNYDISYPLTLINYQIKTKINNKIIVNNFKIPLQFNPSNNTTNQTKTSFHIKFFPKKYFQPHILYQTYLKKHNKKTTLIVRRINPILTPEIITVKITIIIYKKKNQIFLNYLL